jgi:hypothetical protein
VNWDCLIYLSADLASEINGGNLFSFIFTVQLLVLLNGIPAGSSNGPRG